MGEGRRGVGHVTPTWWAGLGLRLQRDVGVSGAKTLAVGAQPLPGLRSVLGAPTSLPVGCPLLQLWGAAHPLTRPPRPCNLCPHPGLVPQLPSWRETPYPAFPSVIFEQGSRRGGGPADPALGHRSCPSVLLLALCR